MQVTRALEYANRAMVLLASSHGSDPLLVSAIAEKISAPPNFLHHVLNSLARGGLVTCLRGSKRGYQLAREPEEISLLDIFEMIEGPLAITSCTTESNWCPREGSCTLSQVWHGIQGQMAEQLKAATLDQLRSASISDSGCPIAAD